VTVTPDYKFRASRKLKDEFDNGEEYFRVNGGEIWLPKNSDLRPNREFLEWHSEAVFRGGRSRMAVHLDSGVQLRRGREIVTDIFSAFGDLRETRLTGALGFLVAKAPYAFGRLFLNGSSISEDVMIEEPEDQSRYDVVIRTKTRLIVIEAKLGILVFETIEKCLRARAPRTLSLRFGPISRRPRR
jgi:hypothetical protein